MNPDVKPLLATSQDVKLMVDTFYAKVQNDALLAPVFNDFAGVDWDSHLPRMYSFWDSVLFARGVFKGRPFAKHIPLPIGAQHFNRWLDLFCSNVDEHFSGATAEDAKARARSIAAMFQSKLQFLRGIPAKGSMP